MLTGERLTISTLLRKFLRPILVTWFLMFFEIALMALIPLFIGFAIDGLLNSDMTAFQHLAMALAGLVVISVIRRIYDTRAYGKINVEVGKELANRSGPLPVSTLNARLGMGRELVGFLEEEIPNLMNSIVQLIVSLIILFAFHPVLSYAAMGAGVLIILFYSLFHRRFYSLNADHNQQTEQQVSILESKSITGILSHLNKLRRIEIRLSDTEAFVYGLIFLILIGFILFNLWFGATNVEITAGIIFSIVSYSWEFVEAALVLPMTLQGWSRLTEIMNRINKVETQTV